MIYKSDLFILIYKQAYFGLFNDCNLSSLFIFISSTIRLHIRFHLD
jgi:hypothetical protein